MHIESSKKTVAKSNEELFHFLMEIKNFQQLMPENISKFEVLAEDKFLFALKGMPEIVLKLKENTPFSQVVLGAASDKLPFTLTADIEAKGENESEVVLSFEGEFNAMMAMMIKAPITNFIGTLSDNLATV